MAEAFIARRASGDSGGTESTFTSFSFIADNERTKTLDSLIGCKGFCFRLKNKNVTDGSLNKSVLTLFYFGDYMYYCTVTCSGSSVDYDTISSMAGFRSESGLISIASPYKLYLNGEYIGYIIN